MKELDAYEDPNHPGNSNKYHTGKTCIESLCRKPAGTAWGRYWCFQHNVARTKKMTRWIKEILAGYERGILTSHSAAPAGVEAR